MYSPRVRSKAYRRLPVFLNWPGSAAAVGEPNAAGQPGRLVAGPVVEDVHGDGAAVGAHSLGHADPGVAEHLEAGSPQMGRIDVDRRIAPRPPGRSRELVRRQVKVVPGEVHRQAGWLVQHEGQGQHHERPRHLVVHLELDLAEDQRARPDDQRGGQVKQVPVQVEDLLLVVGRRGQHQVGPAVPPEAA